MDQRFDHLTEQELTRVIADASKALEHKRSQARREAMAQMKSLAASIGVELVIKEEAVGAASRKGAKVPVKFRDPASPEHARSDRGVKPKWLQAYLEQGRSLDEFRV